MHQVTRMACASLHKAVPFTARSFVQYGFKMNQKKSAINAQSLDDSKTILIVSSPFKDTYIHSVYFCQVWRI